VSKNQIEKEELCGIFLPVFWLFGALIPPTTAQPA
jgi:hypothetical protein